MTDAPHNTTCMILGKRWRLRYTRFPKAPRSLRHGAGECDPPDKKSKEIRLDARLVKRPRLLLEYLIHESLHAAGWPADEAWVEPVARDVAQILWKQGYRLNKCDDAG